MANLWREKEAEIVDSAADTVRQLREFTATDPAEAASAGADAAATGVAPLGRCAEMLAKRYDAELGGFGCGYPLTDHPLTHCLARSRGRILACHCFRGGTRCAAMFLLSLLIPVQRSAAPKFPRPSEINALLRLWALPAAATRSSPVTRVRAVQRSALHVMLPRPCREFVGLEPRIQS